jgi:hypothetical protein
LGEQVAILPPCFRDCKRISAAAPILFTQTNGRGFGYAEETACPLVKLFLIVEGDCLARFVEGGTFSLADPRGKSGAFARNTIIVSDVGGSFVSSEISHIVTIAVRVAAASQ